MEVGGGVSAPFVLVCAVKMFVCAATVSEIESLILMSSKGKTPEEAFTCHPRVDPSKKHTKTQGSTFITSTLSQYNSSSFIYRRLRF